jgi:formamidopyrimidine-DNA glycosylase
MPELPEVESARALIEERALGRRISHVDDADTYVTRPHMPGEIADALTGRTLTSAHRIGKSMWVETDDGEGPTLGLHLGMAGRIVVGDRSAGDPEEGGSAGHPDQHLSGNPAWRRFTLEFDDGGSLFLFDKRRLGRAVLNPDLSHLGPDARDVTLPDFVKRIGSSTAPLKARMMDQSVIAGVGNLLADEVLWRAGFSPIRPADSLDYEELKRLRRAMRASTLRAIQRGGVHTGELIPNRKPGGLCPSCGAGLVRGKVGGRTTWWCPDEQVWPLA